MDERGQNRGPGPAPGAEPTADRGTGGGPEADREHGRARGREPRRAGAHGPGAAARPAGREPERELRRATIPPGVLLGLVDLADRHGVDADWFAGTGLNPERLARPRTLVSYRQAVTVIRRALRSLPPGPVGLTLGSRDPLLTWGTLGAAVRTAATGAEAMRVALRYHQGAGTLMDYRAVREEDRIRVEVLPRTPEPAELVTFMAEEALGGIVVLVRHMFGAAVPLAAELAYPPPPWAAAYRRLWRCPVTFDADRTALLLPGELYDRRVPTANAQYFEAALSATRELLGEGERPPVDDLVADVEAVLSADLRTRRTAAQVAEELSMSPRTLHRRLAGAGESFGAIQDRVRRRHADLLLTRTRRPLTAIAADLGYSDLREFRRAYKRWTSRTPSEVRRAGTAGERPEEGVLAGGALQGPP